MPDADNNVPGEQESPSNPNADRAELVKQAIHRMEEKLGAADVKATFGDFIRLLQLQKELQVEQPREIKVTWIEPSETGSASEK
jgi:hypothetical protein